MSGYDIALLALLGAGMSFGVVIGTRSLLTPLALFTLGYAPAFLLRPLLLLSGMSAPTLPWLMPENVPGTVRSVLWIFAISYASYLVGYSLPGSRNWVQRMLPSFPNQGDWDERRLARICMGVLLLCFAVTLALALRAGGLSAFSNAARQDLFAGMFVVARLPIVASLFAIPLVVSARRSGRSLKMPILLLGLSWFAIVVYDDRSGIVAGILIITLLYHFTVRKVRIVVVVMMLVVAMALLSFLGGLRQSRRLELSGRTTSATHSSFGDRLTSRLNLNVVDHFLVVRGDFDWNTFHLGSDFVIGVQGLVPRFLWPSKPENISPGGWFADRYVGGSGGRPFTAMGEWWLNFGVLGVVMGGLLSGYFGRGLWSYVVAGRGDKLWRILVYGAFMAFVTPWGFISATTAVRGLLIIGPLWLLKALLSGLASSSTAEERQVLIGPVRQVSVPALEA